MHYPLSAFDSASMEAFMPAEKVGIVATINPGGLPHVTLITSIRAANPTTVTLGEFCKGESKSNIKKNPKTAFLIMTMDRRVWGGHAVFTHSRNEGPEYEAYNDLPMFRYNAYFGINTVHYLDLVDAYGPASLPFGSILASSLAGLALPRENEANEKERILSPFAEKLINSLTCLKFLSYVRDDGFPEIIPVLQLRAQNSRRLVFSTLAYGRELSAVPAGAVVAVFGVNLAMENVLVRGRFSGVLRRRFIPMAAVDIEWVYNSMPPAHGQVYPELPLEPVRRFDDFYKEA